MNFSKEISKGAIVFDLGSSTLDFTYLSDKDKPIDFGYDLGASIIDNAILENMILKDDDVILGILQSALHIFVAVADDDAGSSGCGGSAVEAVGLIISGFC